MDYHNKEFKRIEIIYLKWISLQRNNRQIKKYNNYVDVQINNNKRS